MAKTHLIIEGGGFRTAFSAGVLDAFIATNFDEYEGFLGVSGGSIALSYYLSKQYGDYIKAMHIMAADPHFVKMSRAMSEAGVMDIDQLEHIAKEIVPFDLTRCAAKTQDTPFQIVVTDRLTGHALYVRPTLENWIKTVIASCTLPFVTKGSYQMGGKDYFDGGWSDPLPVKKAIADGAQNVLVVRTTPPEVRLTQSWPDYFGSLYFRSNPELSQCFANSHQVYNDALDLMEQAPQGIQIDQIAPGETLKSGVYVYSAASLDQDYRHGLDLGLRYVHGKREAL